MDDEIKTDIKRVLFYNAISHNGKAISKSVLGVILSRHPELRSEVLKVRSEIEKMCEKVNRMKLSKQKEELKKLGGFEEKKKIEKKGLPELPGAKPGKFVVRMAPNPDGAIHIGNARPAVLNYAYAKKYKGTFILRFDDTDPKIKIPEKKFYKWIEEDLKWLGIKWKRKYYASKRLNIYKRYAEELIKMGKAYVCTCGDEWKKYRDKRKPCPCRDLPVKEQMKRWKKMKTYKYKEGEAVLRIKTDLDATNPAVIDWPAFRIVDHPKHPFVKNEHLWPLYNFASSIDDHLLGVTHILRGQEHSTNEVKQRFLFQHFGWKYPVTIIVGRFSMGNMIMSKSKIKEGIKNHQFSGWDDINLGTIRSLRRRGFLPEAITKLIIEIGPKSSDMTISVDNLAAYNRKLIDKITKRFFFVINPIKITVDKIPFKKIEIPCHPTNNIGKRKFKLTNTFYISKDDYDKYKDSKIRLKELFNIRLRKKSKYMGKDIEAIPRIQWVPEDHINVNVLTTGGYINGFGEKNIIKEKVGRVIQFERFGFVRIEKVKKDSVNVIFSHR